MLVDPLLLKPRRESASQIDEFFEEAVEDVVIGGRSSLMADLVERFASDAVRSSGTADSWEDITTSLSKIDPDNADMMLDIGRNLPVKLEPVDDHQHQQQNYMMPPTSKTTTAGAVNRLQRFNYSNGFLPPTPPCSDPGSPSQDSPLRNNSKPPPPYSSTVSLPPPSSQQPRVAKTTSSPEPDKPSRH